MLIFITLNIVLNHSFFLKFRDGFLAKNGLSHFLSGVKINLNTRTNSVSSNAFMHVHNVTLKGMSPHIRYYI